MSTACSLLHYPSAAQNLFASVEDRGLSGRDGALRLVEAHADAGLSERRDGCGRLRVTVAHAHVGAHGLARLVEGYPVDARGCELRAQQLVRVADDDAVRLRLDAHDVERQLSRHAYPAPLARRVAVHALVRAHDAPLRVHYLAARGPLAFTPFRIEVALDEARVVAVGHEANLLRLALLRNAQVVPTRRLARFIFG